MEPLGPRWSEAPQLATVGALVVLRVEGLRPAVKALGDRSYQEDALNAIESQVAQAMTLLNPEWPEAGIGRRPRRSRWNSLHWSATLLRLTFRPPSAG
jgi:hypothetical protein